MHLLARLVRTIHIHSIQWHQNKGENLHKEIL
jgi:hypothetical protein